jgi:hypothetical protein
MMCKKLKSPVVSDKSPVRSDKVQVGYDNFLCLLTDVLPVLTAFPLRSEEKPLLSDKSRVRSDKVPVLSD